MRRNSFSLFNRPFSMPWLVIMIFKRSSWKLHSVPAVPSIVFLSFIFFFSRLIWHVGTNTTTYDIYFVSIFSLLLKKIGDSDIPIVWGAKYRSLCYRQKLSRYRSGKINKSKRKKNIGITAPWFQLFVTNLRYIDSVGHNHSRVDNVFFSSPPRQILEVAVHCSISSK